MNKVTNICRCFTKSVPACRIRNDKSMLFPATRQTLHPHLKRPELPHTHPYKHQTASYRKAVERCIVCSRKRRFAPSEILLLPRACFPVVVCERLIVQNPPVQAAVSSSFSAVSSSVSLALKSRRASSTVIFSSSSGFWTYLAMFRLKSLSLSSAYSTQRVTPSSSKELCFCFL